MHVRRSIPIALGTSLALLIALVAGGVAVAGGRPFTVAPLTGAAEAPTAGDPDGTGSARFWMNPGTGQVCWDYSVSGVQPLIAAHIHHAPAGVPGPVVIPMMPMTATGGADCATVDRALIQDILVHPGDYYFNVHTDDFKAGALRGQLSRTP
jgi:CHRD domain-containing protein